MNKNNENTRQYLTHNDKKNWEKTSTELNKLLIDREKRHKIRQKISENFQIAVSLTFNIPGFPKHNALINSCFDIVVEDILIFLQSWRIFISDNIFDKIDHAGRFFIIPLNENNLRAFEIKKITEQFEQTHQLGRIIDLDVFDATKGVISSGKSKKCFLCENSANICRHKHTHSTEELKKFVSNKLQKFLEEQNKKQIIKKISIAATKAILFEVSLTPKPGLVNCNNSGSHTDMNFYTFMSSSAAISEYWHKFAQLAFSENINLSKTLPKIRKIGLKAEKEMYLQTKKVNTQKGIIFLLGISIFATAYSLKNNKKYNEENIRTIIKKISENIVENELINNKNEMTSHGEKLFLKYGKKAAGARMQVQKGLPIVFDNILPYLRQNFDTLPYLDKKKSDNTLLTALLKIISVLDDTNILYRNGHKVAEKLKILSKNIILSKTSYNKLSDFCDKQKISSGGAADILSVSLFFYFIEKDFLKYEK